MLGGKKKGKRSLATSGSKKLIWVRFQKNVTSRSQIKIHHIKLDRLNSMLQRKLLMKSIVEDLYD